MNDSILNTNREHTVTVKNGWTMLPVIIAILFGSLALFIYSIATSDQNGGHPNWPLFIVGLLGMILAVVMMPGLFTLQPNEARVLILFGRYKGTVRDSGFHWGNPFYSNGGKSGQRGLSFRMKLQAIAEKRTPAENPLMLKQGWRNKISLRARNLNSEKLKV